LKLRAADGREGKSLRVHQRLNSFLSAPRLINNAGNKPKILRSYDEFGHPFPPCPVRPLSAYIEDNYAPPPRRSSNNFE
jgi:hypothetical protein